MMARSMVVHRKYFYPPAESEAFYFHKSERAGLTCLFQYLLNR